MSNPLLFKPRWSAVPTGLKRRTLLGSLAATILAPTTALSQTNCQATRDSGEGPFYFDPELLRSDIREDATGTPLSISIRIMRASDCAILEGARFDIWQADAMGLYSGYRNQPGIPGTDSTAAADKRYLRGTQITDATGQVSFHTVFPNWYGNRTPHIHFKVFLSEEEIIASQLFFTEEVIGQVFNTHEPYRSHVDKRRVRNENDMFLRTEPVGGVFCEVDAGGMVLQATALVVVQA